MHNIKVLLLTTEVSPFAKEGGMADVCAFLPKAIREEGIDIRIITPKFRYAVKNHSNDVDKLAEFEIEMDGKNVACSLERLNYKSNIIYFVNCQHYFDREYVYGYPDEAERFIFFSKAVINAIKFLDFEPEVLHLNDWHFSFVTFFLATKYRNDEGLNKLKTLFTIHNFGFQGVFKIEENLRYLRISEEEFNKLELEFYGQMNFIKAALKYSDYVNTVSPTHALEIQNDMKELDMGTDRKIYGILNGLDLQEWNPATDRNLYANFQKVDYKQGKARNKRFLQSEFNLEINSGIPLISVVSRFVRDKGFDLIECAFPEILKENIQLVLMGNGSEYYEKLMSKVSERYPGKVCACRYNESLARKIYAGSDMFLMPSHYEPCGTTQIISMRYGTVPIASATGGLSDTIKDFDEGKGTGCGFLYKPQNPWVMLHAIRRALKAYKNEAVWGSIVEEALVTPVSWEASAKEYIKLYKEMTD